MNAAVAARGSRSMQVNMHEVRMAGALVKYLLQQGYSADQLVLLTPYLGQLMELTKGLKKTTQVSTQSPSSHSHRPRCLLGQAGQRGRMHARGVTPLPPCTLPCPGAAQRPRCGRPVPQRAAGGARRRDWERQQHQPVCSSRHH